MKLLNFRAHNLFSLGDVTLDLKDRGLLLVTGYSEDEGGMNGSGKSSISNKGIIWTLFGATAGGERADSVINRFSEGSCYGEIILEASNGALYVVTRKRNPNKLILLQNGQDISARQEKDTQEKLNKILGRDKETFIQTDFFGQGKASSFLELTPKAQMELLETILPFDQITTLATQTKDHLTRITTALTLCDREMATWQGKVDQCNTQERTVSLQMDQWDRTHFQTIENLKAEIARLREDTSIDDEIISKRTELENLHPLNFLKQGVEREQHQIDSSNKELNEWLTNRKQYQTARVEWQNELKKLKIAINPGEHPDKCPTCTGPIDAQKHTELLNLYKTYTNAKTEMDKQIASIDASLIDIDKNLEWRREELTLLSNNVQKYNAEIKRHSDLNNDILLLENKKLTNKIPELEARLADEESSKNPFSGVYQQNTNETLMAVRELNSRKNRLDILTKDKNGLEFWHSAFNKELKNEYINSVCPYIESRINSHLEGLGNAQIRVDVRTQKELKSTNTEKSEFTITCSSLTGGGSYDSLSGGEKSMVNFATGLALADLAECQVDGPSFLTILDEPFVALDDRNSENLVNYLQSYLVPKKSTILLVSNEESLKMLIPNRIHVIKKNGVSRLAN